MKKENFWWNLPAYIDRWRIFPRIFISVYIYLLYESVIWFMALGSPSMEQAGLISVIFSVGGFWFNSYLMTPAKRLEQLEKTQSTMFKNSKNSGGYSDEYSTQQEQNFQNNTGRNYE